MLKSGYWQDLTTEQLQNVDPERTIALLPISAV
jgi:creatinine amidohydrolase